MTNINAFYPQRLKGWALGLNAGGGNIGVPVIQLVGLLVIATARQHRAVDRLRRLPGALSASPPSAPPCSWTTSATRRPTCAPWSRRCKFRDSWVISLPLHRHVRLVHRLQLRLRPGPADQLPRRWRHPRRRPRCTPRRSPSSARCSARSPGPLGGKLADRIGGGKITLTPSSRWRSPPASLVAAGTVDDGTRRRRHGRMHGRAVARLHRPVRPLRASATARSTR